MNWKPSPNLESFQGDLLGWYRQNRRSLPWRESTDRYRVWVSEVMLQQTTVAAAEGYFRRWMDRFPTVEALACASIDEAMAHWQGLGYYRRCRLLHAGAQKVTLEGWPRTFSEWLAVPGVGAYTAGAILSIAEGVSAAAVDGNVKRVYSRLADDASSGPTLEKAAWKWAESVLATASPGDWTQALMELGAVICTPKSPSCRLCPLTQSCAANKNQTVNERPLALPRPAFVERHFDVVVLFDSLTQSRVLLRQVPMGEWWAGLYEFPRTPLVDPTAYDSDQIGVVKTVVTKHKITMNVFTSVTDSGPTGYDWVDVDRLPDLALSSPMRKIANLALSGGGQGRFHLD